MLEKNAAILERILGLKDYSPFILVCDTLAQSADQLIAEIEYRRQQKPGNIHREVVYLRDLQNDPQVAQTIQRNLNPGTTVIGIVHTDPELITEPEDIYSPHGLPLLEYLATSVIKIIPSNDALQRLADDPHMGIFDFSDQVYNLPIFRVDIVHRRKTGRSLSGSFEIDTTTHTSQFLSPQTLEVQQIPENLTTFNLSLNDKQKEKRENLELPYMAAQQGPEEGGAIVYQFEKDDDYDEEDPYEDPF